MIYENKKKNSNGWEYKELRFAIDPNEVDGETNEIVQEDKRKTGGNNGILRWNFK